MDSSSSNRRIARNTMMLYARMLLTMSIGLASSRIILNALGVVDYGLYNVVGGFVSFFSVISASMSSTISRFITYEIGKDNADGLGSVFSMSVIIQLFISVVIVLLAETIGLWFFYNKLVIPEDRIEASFWVFQFSIVTFVFSLIAVPYNAALIAHEAMGKFAQFAIFESLLKFSIVILVKYAPVDKYLLYSFLICLLSWFMRYVYMRYCRNHFKECTFHFIFDKTVFKRIFVFSGWNSVGLISAVFRTQGATVLLNLFGGPVVNAASGIASTITGVIQSLVSNFTTAFSPQMTKSYAAGNHERLCEMIYLFSRLSYFMMFVFVLPVFFNVGYILHLWLGTVPQHSVAFVRLILLFMLVEVLAQPITTAKKATGDIKVFELLGIVQLFALPCSYFLLRKLFPVEVVYLCVFVCAVLAFILRINTLNKDIKQWRLFDYLRVVIVRIVVVSIVCTLITTIVYLSSTDTLSRFLFSTIASVISCTFSIFFWGLSSSERMNVVKHITSVWLKLN